MSSFLVDSDVIISCTKRRADALTLLDWVIAAEDEGLPRVSAVTVFEVLQGLRHPDKPIIRRFLAGFRHVPVDGRIAHVAAHLVRERRHRGETVVMGDALIAATALLYDLVVVTANRKHFLPLGVRLHPSETDGDKG